MKCLFKLMVATVAAMLGVTAGATWLGAFDPGPLSAGFAYLTCAIWMAGYAFKDLDGA
jgi:hypothetical protein